MISLSIHPDLDEDTSSPIEVYFGLCEQTDAFAGRLGEQLWSPAPWALRGKTKPQLMQLWAVRLGAIEVSPMPSEWFVGFTKTEALDRLKRRSHVGEPNT